MTTQSTIVRPDALEQVIQTVIQDIWVSKNLRTALALYQNQRADLNNHWITEVRNTSANLSNTLPLGGGCKHGNSHEAPPMKAAGLPFRVLTQTLEAVISLSQLSAMRP
jgi:hypothetical protein